MPDIPSPPAPLNLQPISAYSLVKSALRLTGIIAAGEDIPEDEASDALMVFNQMVDAWNADRLAIFTTSSNDFPFTLNKQSYTLGGGGDFDMIRPAQIDSMSAIILTNAANPIEYPMSMFTVQQWQNQLPVKQVFGSFPLICYDDGNFPLRTLNFWPIPQQQNAVRIYSWQPLNASATFDTSLSFPPGYQEAFRFNTAVRLAAEFGAAVPASVQQLAIESLARLKTINAPLLQLRSDLLAAPDAYNYKADMFGIPY